MLVSYPIELKAIAELDGFSAGVGLTFAGGYENFFGVLDMNNVWTYMNNFKKPVKTTVLSPRIGATFKFKKNPKSNIGFWVGAMMVNMGGITEGSISLGEVFTDETWEKRDDMVGNYYRWYDGIDENKQNIADQVLTPIVENIAESNGEGTVLYKISKEPSGKWNMLLGAQYQINKHVQVRTEFGFLGERSSWLLSANYRFGIRHIK